MDRGVWWATFHVVTKSQTQLSNQTTTLYTKVVKRGNPEFSSQGKNFFYCFNVTPWKESCDQPGQHIEKQRHYFANKGLSSQDYAFSSSHVWM